MDLRPVLDVRDLRVAYVRPGAGVWHALSGVNFTLDAGEILGVLGESGSGKSTLALSLLRLLPGNARITGGEILLHGADVARLDALELQRLRGSNVSIVFQEPSLALHPTMRVADQIGEVLRAHQGLSRQERRARTRQILSTIFAEDVDRISAAYPHQLSGGQQQRVLIAQAIACEPSLVIADEPTASLDPSTQREIIALFRSLRDQLGIAFLFITHNPLLLADFADRVLVLYAGKVAELGPAGRVLTSPQHPYTQALLQCLPHYDGDYSARKHRVLLPVIPGPAPTLASVSPGCLFEPRCDQRMPSCQLSDPPSALLADRHQVACLKFPA